MLNRRIETFIGLGMLLVAGAAAAGPAPPTPTAEERNNARRYAACMAQAENAPGDAFDTALAWRDMGGGDAAEHCMAKALFYLKQYPEAAQRFEDLARKVNEGPGFKAALLDQAAQAWQLADNAQRAEQVLTVALKLAPDALDLLIDRGRARADLSWYKAAVTDFSRAIELYPRSVTAYTYRAAAYRYLNDLKAAMADAEKALELDSEDPDALLERGILRRLAGDEAGARADWMLAIEVAPDTPVARTARANLQRMELSGGAGDAKSDSGDGSGKSGGGTK